MATGRKKEIEDQIVYMSRVCTKIERDPESKELLKTWQAFESLPDQEKARIRAEWNQYYKDVTETPVYAMFQEQAKALKQQNYRRVKEIADEVKQMRENGDLITLKTPEGIDPFDFDNNPVLRMYRNYKRKIEEMKKSPELYTDFGEAFGVILALFLTLPLLWYNIHAS